MGAVQRDEVAPAYALPLGPDSLTWRYFGDGRMILLGPRAAVLQNMLPALGQGVEDHSVWFAETLARLRRSIPPIYNTVFGADPEASGHEVRDFHRPIKGRLPDGSAYSALNPDTYYWAHACFVEHLITATDTFIRRLSRAEKEQIFAESVTWFERYGVSSRGTPQTYAEFESYFEHTLEERLVKHRTASYGVGYATKGWPRPKQVPRPVWWLVRRPVNAMSSSLTIGGMPPQGARDPRAAMGRRARAPLPAVRAGVPRAGPPLPPAAGPAPDPPDPAAGLPARRRTDLTGSLRCLYLGDMADRSPLGLLDTDSLINEEDRAIQQTVRKFVDDRIRPDIAEWYENGSTPVREIARDLGGIGALGMHLEGYGCAGTSTTAYGLACMEVEAGDSGIRSLMSVQGSLAMFAIHAHGSEEQKEQWLPQMATGEKIGCFGLTESDFGSNPSGMRTRARQDGSDWVLDGTKMWITNGSVADVAVVWAQTDDGIRGFVVPTETEGFSAPDIKQKMSMRASVTSELVLDGVRLPADAMLPEAKGLRGPLSCLTEARFGIIFGSIGAARDCLEATLRYAEEREIFDKPLGAFQLTQAKLADMTVELGKSMLLALHLGRLKDDGRITAEQVSFGKLNNIREAIKIARECRTIMGAAGITLEWPMMRHANNLESVLTYEGTSEVHQLVLGKALTGQDAFR